MLSGRRLVQVEACLGLPAPCRQTEIVFLWLGVNQWGEGIRARPPPLGALGVFVRLGLHLGPESIGRPVPALRSGLSRASASTRPGSPVFSFFSFFFFF